MLDLVPQFKKELQIPYHSFCQRTLCVFQTRSQFEIFISALLRLLNRAVLIFMSVIDAFMLEPSVQKIGPRNDCRHDEELCAEIEACAVKCLNRRKHGFSRFQ